MGEAELEFLSRACEAFLSGLPGLELHPVDEKAAKEGARLRARYGLRASDALHLAAALVHGATAFPTNAGEFRKAHGYGLEIFLL